MDFDEDKDSYSEILVFLQSCVMWIEPAHGPKSSTLLTQSCFTFTESFGFFPNRKSMRSDQCCICYVHLEKQMQHHLLYLLLQNKNLQAVYGGCGSHLQLFSDIVFLIHTTLLKSKIILIIFV